MDICKGCEAFELTQENDDSDFCKNYQETEHTSTIVDRAIKEFKEKGSSANDIGILTSAYFKEKQRQIIEEIENLSR